jgi:predicted tellurium resistance membrane protein TerC
LNDRQLDRVSLAAGVLIVVIGIAMVLDQSSEVSLSGGVIAALFVGVFGLILLISGLLEDR